MSVFAKAKAALAKSFTWDRDHGGLISKSWPINYWQTDNRLEGGRNDVVYACVQAYAKTVAQLPGKHVRKDAQGYDSEILNSPLVRAMARPNAYQTRSDFLLNLVCALLYEGNAYAYVLRNTRFEIEELHLLPSGSTNYYVHEGEIFYHVTPDPVSGITTAMMVPAREILHIRLHTPDDPLRGETPIYAAAMAIGTNNSISGHQATFFENMSRPSGVITTDEKLNSEQIEELRTKWEEQSKGLNSGKVPILSWGLKWSPLSITSVDAELIKAQKLSTERIAAVFGVPLPIIGVLEDAKYNNVHELINFWKATGLGFLLEHVEQNIARLFDLPPNERFELDSKHLLRTDMVARVEALVKGVTGGVYAPNEARKEEGLGPVEDGDMPRVQRQMVPLNYEPPEDSVEPEEASNQAAFVAAIERMIN